MREPSPHVFPFGVLGPSDPHPVIHERRGLSPILLVCDHAGNAVPQSLAMGVSEADLNRHIGIDIGALGVARVMSERLDAEFIGQPYSRLVIDCNRPPSEPSAFPTRVDGSDVPGNVNLAAAAAAARTAEIFHPYHSAIAEALNRRIDAGITPALIAVHTYTPFHSDFPDARPWNISFLFDKDPSLALALEFRRHGLTVGENEPYQVGAVGDYTIPVHGEPRGIPHTLIEVRQDQVTDPTGETLWGERLASALETVLGTKSERMSA
ncbi:MAG: N-formylglutamate amidohydrolase [Pseudomonadota bacterium]